MITEKDAWTINGYLAIVILIVFMIVSLASFFNDELAMGIVFGILAVVFVSGFSVIHPNEAIIVQFAGQYIGTYRQEGIILFIPFSKRNRISLKERIYQSGEIITHDIYGNAVPISIVLLFKIVDAAKAVFDVEDMERYIAIQSEMSLRQCMTSYAFNEMLTDEQTLRQITQDVKNDLMARLPRTGVELSEIRLIPSTLYEQEKLDFKVQDSLHLTDQILTFMEKEKIIQLTEEKKLLLKNKLSLALSKEL